MAAAADHELAHEIAQAAGALLLELRARADGAEADAASHALIVERLAAARPGDVVRSEEGARGDPGGAERVWIVDPLDGTREYCEQGRDDWAVHVALWQRGRLVAGAVALPARGEVVSTHAPLPLPPGHGGAPRVVVSRSRAPEIARAVADALGAELLEQGSAGAKTITVARGNADLYLHAGGQYVWDTAAPAVVAEACGLHVSRLDGSAPRYDAPDPWLPDVLVCRPELAEAVLTLTA